MTKSGKIAVQRKNRYIIIFILFVILLLLLFFFRYEKKSYITFPDCFVTTEYCLYHIPLFKKTVPHKFLNDFITANDIHLTGISRKYYLEPKIVSFLPHEWIYGNVTGIMLTKLSSRIEYNIISIEDAKKILILLDAGNELDCVEFYYEVLEKAATVTSE